MFSNMIKRLVMVGVLLGMGLVAVGLDLPPVVPKGPDWQIYWDLEWKGTCDCYSWETFTLDTSAARDFTVSEKAAQKTAFLDLFDGHCTFRGDATYTYNCHGYVFDGSESWGGNPSYWKPAVPTPPCYEVDATGPIYRWGTTHSAIAGTEYTYKGKCGREILCDHDDEIYGAHAERWKVAD